MFWERLSKAFEKELAVFSGTVSEFIAAQNANIHVVGRVYFHLVENKSEEYPFAFLATYATEKVKGKKVSHVPLKNALIEYKNQQICYFLYYQQSVKHLKQVTLFQNWLKMVLSIKAGGVGLNLTAANHVIHFDRWWNPAIENQATDRAFRIGQKKNVLVHKFVTFGTIEEKIDLMIENKQKMTGELIESSGENWITEMSNDELMQLFTLG